MLQSRISRFSTLPVAEQDVGSSDAPSRLFEYLLAEVQAVGADIAVVTTAANALNDWRASIDPGAIARMAPQSATLRALLPVLDNNHALDPRVGGELTTFLAGLDAARFVLENYLNDCDAISPSRAGLVHARLLQNSWRTLALDAKRIILEVERTANVPVPEIYQQNTRVVSALLSGAGNGLKPCLDDNGHLYLPPLPQRRRAPRRAVLQNCVVHGPANVQTGFIRDASAGGLGLGRVTNLKRGDRVRIDLVTGRQLHGEIVWVIGFSAGVRFDVTLDPSDSLIAV